MLVQVYNQYSTILFFLNKNQDLYLFHKFYTLNTGTMAKTKKRNPMAKKVKVLLLKPLPPKGNAGDIIDVKIHYATQVLIPQGIAVIYDKQTENQRAAHMKKVAKNKAELQKNVVNMIEAIKTDGGITFIKNATETGTLYDSISHKTIAQYIADTYKARLSTDCFSLENKIEAIGEYTVDFVYEDLKATFDLHVLSDKADAVEKAVVEADEEKAEENQETKKEKAEEEKETQEE